MSSRPVHFEMTAVNPDRAAKFYESVFGWTAMKWQGPVEYWLLTTGECGEPGINVGLARRAKGDRAETVNPINVSSVDEYIARVSDEGGATIRPKMPIPGVGYLAYCQDTEGNTFGLFQEDTSAR